MRTKIPLMLALGTLAFLSVPLLGPAAAAGQAGPVEPPDVVGTVAGEKIGWELKDARVVNPGASMAVPQGTLINGYTIEATATPIGDAGSVKAKFRMTASLFSPNGTMAGQKVGHWYMTGIWTITDSKEVIPAKVRHSPGMLSGRFLAELPFNPASASGKVDATLLLSGVSAPGHRAAAGGKGTFSGNEKFEGRIQFSKGKVEVKPAGATSKEAGR